MIIEERVDVMMEAVCDPEVLLRRLWLEAAVDVSIVDVRGSWQGVPEASWLIVFYGSTLQGDAVVASLHGVAREFGQEAILVERRPSDARLEVA